MQREFRNDSTHPKILELTSLLQDFRNFSTFSRDSKVFISAFVLSIYNIHYARFKVIKVEVKWTVYLKFETDKKKILISDLRFLF